MSAVPDFIASDRIDEIADEYEARCRVGGDPDPTEYVGLVPDGLRTELLIELLCVDASYRLRRGELFSIAQYLKNFPLLLAATSMQLESFNLWLSRVVARRQESSATLVLSDKRVADGDAPQPFPRFVGRFRLLHQLGAGGFGTVYRAHDPELNRDVAVKVPRAAAFATARDEDRFLREAQGMAALDHPGIVRILDAGRSDEICFLVSQLVEGESLEHTLRNRTFDFRESARLIAAVADALEHAHQHGVVHRDVKPGNILLNQSGQPRIADFGTALLVDADAAAKRTGELIGTPAYMAPEQATGSRKNLDHRVDVYALGVIQYELLTGERPFRGSTAQILHQIASLDPPCPSALRGGIPRDLQTICQKAMSRDVHSRYRRAADLRDDLLRFLDNRPIHARPVGIIGIVIRWSRRNRLTAALASGVAALLLATTILIASALIRGAEVRRQTVINQSRSQARVATMELESGSLRGFPKLLESADLVEAIPEERASRLRVLNGWVQAVDDRGIRVMHHNDLGLSAAFKPNSSLIAVATNDRLITVWNAETGQQITQLTDQKLPGQKGFHSLRFSSSGHRLMTFSGSRCMIYDTTEWISVADVECRFAVISYDGRIRVMDLTDGSVAIPPLPRPEPAMLVAFSPDSRHMACATQSGSIHLWATDNLQYLGSIFDHQGSPKSLEFSSDSSRMLACGGTPAVHSWKPTPFIDPGIALQHDDRVSGADFCPAGMQLATITEGGQLQIWDARTGTATCEAVFVFDPKVVGDWPDRNTCRFHPTEPILAVGNGWGQLTLWNVSAGRPVRTRTIPPNDRYNIRQPAFHPDGERLMICSNDRFAAVQGLDEEPVPMHKIEHPDQVWSIDVARHGRYFATGCQDGRVRIFSASAPYPLIHELDFGAVINAVCFSPDGRFLLAAPADRTARFIRCNSWQAQEQVIYGDSFFESVACSPDGHRVVTASNAGQIQVWDVETGLPCGPSVYHRMYASSVRFNPLGIQIVSTSFDRFARLHDVWDRISGLSPLQIDKAVSGISGHPPADSGR